MRKRPILLVISYHYFAHYRRPVLSRIADDPRVHLVLVSGDDAETPGITLIDGDAAIGNAPFHGMRTRVSNWWFLKRFLWQSGLLSSVQRMKPDVVVTLGNMYHISTWVLCLICRLRGIPVLMWGHGFVRERGFAEAFRAIFYRLADGHLLYGERARSLMIKRGFAPEKLFVVHNSLDVDSQTQSYLLSSRADVSRSTSAASRSIRIVFIGRLTFQKRLDLLVHAVVALSRLGLNATVRMIGDGEARKQLEDLASSLGVADSFLWLGSLYSEPDIAQQFSSSDVCVIPGRVGLTVMHSLAYGVPVVVNDDLAGQNPEIEAVIPDVTGLYFRKDDPEDLAECLRRFLELGRSNSDWSASCRRVIEQEYNPDVQADRIVNAVERFGLFKDGKNEN